MTRAALVLAVVSALCMGMAFGFVGGVVFSRHVLHGGSGFARMFERHFDHGGRFGMQRRGGLPSPRTIVPRLQRMLDLTPAQADAIRGEIERTRGDFAQVRDSLHARIERHLTPAQRDRWREMVKEGPPGEPRGRDPRHDRAEPGKEGDESR
jgi:hypothetical protein